MIGPCPILGLSEIAEGFDVAFVDVWGVIHDGRRGFLPALEACRRFRAARGPVVLVSNSPRPGSELPAQFRAIGFPADFFDAIVTSGDATRAELAARAPGPTFKIGPPKDEPIYHGLALAFTAEVETAAFLSCTGLFDDERETPEDYTDLLARARRAGLTMVCANPDLTVRVGDRVIYCAGAIGAAYAGLGGEVVLCGKPHGAIYDAAEAAAGGLLGRELDPARILAIGDGPGTDLLGAETRGYPALFVAGGLHGAELAGDGPGFGARAAAVLAAAGTRADFAIEALTW